MKTQYTGVPTLPDGCIPELYEITISGTTTYFTTHDTDIVYGGHTYQANYFVISRGDVTQAQGIEVNTCDVTLTNRDIGGGVMLSAAVLEGYLDLAYVRIMRARTDYVCWLFDGFVTETKPTRTEVILTVSDPKVLLNVQMPRNIYSVSCINRLYDTACGLAKASFQTHGTLTYVGSQHRLFSNDLTSFADGYFDFGIFELLDNTNAVVETKTIKRFLQTSGDMLLVAPLVTPVLAGYVFNVYPGCNHQKSICASAKFNNLAHFRGMPYMPVPEDAV